MLGCFKALRILISRLTLDFFTGLRIFATICWSLAVLMPMKTSEYLPFPTLEISS